MKLKEEYIKKCLSDFHYELTREQLEQDWRFDEQPYYKEKDCWCFHAKDGCWLEVSNCDIFDAFDVSDAELVKNKLKSEGGCDFKSTWDNNTMKPITQLYRIVEGALKDDISMVMRYAKRLMQNNSMDIDWDETEKGVQEILNEYNHRPAKIATLDDNKYYCHFNETEIDPKECETCGARDCCEHNLEKIEDKKQYINITPLDDDLGSPWRKHILDN